MRASTTAALKLDGYKLARKSRLTGARDWVGSALANLCLRITSRAYRDTFDAVITAGLVAAAESKNPYRKD